MALLSYYGLRRTVGIAIAVLFVCVPKAASVQLRPAQLGTISGRIFSPDGTPSVGVRVAAMPATGVPGQAPGNGALMSLTQTDADGRYRLESVLPGSYFVMVGALEAPFYLPGVASQANATVITVNAGANMAAPDFRLTTPLAVKVSGRVVRDGHLAGNQLILSRSGVTVNAVIAPDGSFAFPSVRPGIYQARVTPGVSTLPPTTVVAADSDITGLEIPIPLSAVDILVTVNVTMEGGGSIPRFQLQFMPAGPLPAEAAAALPNNVLGLSGGLVLVGANGTNMAILAPSTQRAFSQQIFPQTDYRVRVSPTNNPLPEGYVVKSMTVDSVDVTNRSFKLSAAKPTVIAITLGVGSASPFVKLKGRVTGMATASAVATGISLLGNVTTTGPMSSTVNPDGSFEFESVLPGTYQARLTPAADPFTRTIVVNRGDTTEVEIPMRIPTLRVSARTTDEAQLRKDGQLSANQFLRASLRPEQRVGSVAPSSSVVAADGSFTFPQVQAGQYIVSVSICESDLCTSSGGTSITVDRDLDGLFVPLKGIDLVVNNPQTFQTSTPADVVEGSVTMEGGAPIPRFRIKFIVGAVTRSASVSGKAFTAALPRGDYKVSIADLPAGYEVRSLSDGVSDLGFWPLSVAPPPDGGARVGAMPRLAITLGVASSAPWVKVSGRVVGPGAAAKVVELTGALLVDKLTVVSGPDGSFEFPRVLPDTYTVRLEGSAVSSGTVVVGPTGVSGLEVGQ